MKTYPFSCLQRRPSLTHILLVILIGAVGYLIFAMTDPVGTLRNVSKRRMVAQVAKLAQVQDSTFRMMVELGKAKGFENIEVLRAQNAINAKIYADANTGDYALVFGEKLVIYRPHTQKIIYNGVVPGSVQAAQTQETIAKLVQAINEAGYIDDTNKETPHVLTVQDVQKLPDIPFYTSAQVGDLVITFPTSGITVLYSVQKQKVIAGAQSQLRSISPFPHK